MSFMEPFWFRKGSKKKAGEYQFNGIDAKVVKEGQFGYADIKFISM